MWRPVSGSSTQRRDCGGEVVGEQRRGRADRAVDHHRRPPARRAENQPGRGGDVGPAEGGEHRARDRRRGRGPGAARRAGPGSGSSTRCRRRCRPGVTTRPSSAVGSAPVTRRPPPRPRRWPTRHRRRRGSSSSMPSSAARSASAQPARSAASICSWRDRVLELDRGGGRLPLEGHHAGARRWRPDAAAARRCGGPARRRRPRRRRATPVSRTTRVDSNGRGNALPCTPAMNTTASASMPERGHRRCADPDVDGRQAVAGGDGGRLVGQRQSHPRLDVERHRRLSSSDGGSAVGCTAIRLPALRALKRAFDRHGVAGNRPATTASQAAATARFVAPSASANAASGRRRRDHGQARPRG